MESVITDSLGRKWKLLECSGELPEGIAEPQGRDLAVAGLTEVGDSINIPFVMAGGGLGNISYVRVL